MLRLDLSSTTETVCLAKVDMPRVTDKLRDAQALAEFSNLEPAQVEYFRHNFPDFVPDAWWGYKNGVQWRKTQEFLRRWWKNCSIRDMAEVVRLVSSVFNPGDIFPGSPFEDAPDLPTFASFDEMSWGAAPFQKGVLYLFEQPWRARFCMVCNKRFVAAEPKNKFCSETCSHENSIRRKREWFRENGKQWRRKVKRAKAKAARRRP
jgi:hypothetical protein